MDIKDEILINKYAQNIVTIDFLLEKFNCMDYHGQKSYLNFLMMLINQSKAVNDDILIAVEESKLKSTYTPCILLIKGGIGQHNLLKISNLPYNEYEKVFMLFLNLFKIAYHRRFKQEYNNPHKWWYWDLSDDDNIQRLKKE